MEDWLKKCLSCVYSTYNNKEEADEISCTHKNGNCNYKKVDKKSYKDKGEDF